MSDDLIKRLRKTAAVSNDGNLRGPALEAADRIEELEAENKRLRVTRNLLENRIWWMK